MFSLWPIILLFFSCFNDPPPQTDEFNLTPGLWSGYVEQELGDLASINSYVYFYVEKVDEGKAHGFLFHDLGTMIIDGQEVEQCVVEEFITSLDATNKKEIKLDCLDSESPICINANLSKTKGTIGIIVYSLLHIDITLNNYQKDDNTFEMLGCNNNSSYLPVSGNNTKSSSLSLRIKNLQTAWNLKQFKNKASFSIYDNLTIDPKEK